MELNTARVFVNDIEAARQFYSAKLGLPLKTDASPYGYCVFKAGSTELVVETVANDAPEEDKILVGRFTGLSFTVQDIVMKHKELLALGVPFTGLLRISAIVDACFRLIVDGVSAPSWTRGGCAQARSSMYLSRPRSV